MAKHKYFEELCALAPLGELGPAQLGDLAGHISACEECRRAAAEYDRIYRQIVPAVNGPDDKFIAARRSEIRSSVLASIAEAAPQPATARTSGVLHPWVAPVPSARQFALWGGLAASLLAGVSFWIGVHSVHSPRRTLPQVASAPVVKQGSAGDRLEQNGGFVSGLGSTKDDLKNKQWLAALDAERSQSTEFAREASAGEKELEQAMAAQNVLRTQLEMETKTLDVTRAVLRDKEAQLNQAQAANSSNTTTLVALQYQVQYLTKKLDSETTNLDRERDLLGHGREIRDIVGARNLHIIDVYDTDSDGTTKRPFARAFYTEHKSLVYYAYDLPQRYTTEGKYSYVAWGERNGNKKSIQKIGILYNDDQTQKRWNLNFSDPKVLADIDSVFITLERTDKDVEQPKGRRMLTAYLGAAPNHP